MTEQKDICLFFPSFFPSVFLIFLNFYSILKASLQAVRLIQMQHDTGSLIGGAKQNVEDQS